MGGELCIQSSSTGSRVLLAILLDEDAAIDWQAAGDIQQYVKIL